MLVPTPPHQLGTFPACREVNQMLGRMGDKWTIMTIAMLVQRPTRFNELKRMIGGIFSADADAHAQIARGRWLGIAEGASDYPASG